MPPEVWIIMGNRAVGKSTAIRALTGIYQSKKTDVKTLEDVLECIFVHVRSLQEKKIQPSSFINDHNNNRYVLLSLRVDKIGNFPKGLEYIQKFINNNWDIRKIVVLGTNNLPYTLPGELPAPIFITNSNDIPANQVAHEIREDWNWL